MKTLINAVKASVQSFAMDDEGTVAIEYVLVAGLVSIVIVPMVAVLTGASSGLFDAIAAINTFIALI